VKAFFDSSAFAKRYIEEEGSFLVDEICRDADELSISVICIPEIVSALNRRVRETSCPQKITPLSNRPYPMTARDLLIINLTEDVIDISMTCLKNIPFAPWMHFMWPVPWHGAQTCSFSRPSTNRCSYKNRPETQNSFKCKGRNHY